jgi:hypothetical protein
MNESSQATTTPHFDLAVWQVHEVENDCELIIRTNNGRVFYCQVSPSRFHRSPAITTQYFRCLDLLRSGEEEIDDFYMEDAYHWLSKLFKPLITQLAPASLNIPGNGRPTLSHYLFAPYFVCSIEAIDGKIRPYQLNTQEHGWSKPVIVVDGDFITELDQWTRLYHPSDIEICYNRARDVLIKPPVKVIVKNGNGNQVICFFKPFELSFGPAHAKRELLTFKKITMAKISPATEAWICRLYGIVRDETGLFGMLFTWINKKGVLSATRAAQNPLSLRNRWATQIKDSLAKLHNEGIIWGDAKAENILIDEDDNAWIIDFGGSYTIGWVDKDKAGTIEGDLQGLAKILAILR